MTEQERITRPDGEALLNEEMIKQIDLLTQTHTVSETLMIMMRLEALTGLKKFVLTAEKTNIYLNTVNQSGK